VRLSTLCKHRIHAVLADRGIRGHSSLWTGPGRAWLAGLELPATPRRIIQDCCGLLDAPATPIARLDHEIAGLAKPDPRVQALQVLPGVGKLTAMTLVAEIGDIGRFPRPASCAPGPGSPPGAQLPPHGPPWPYHQAGLAVGAGILQEAAQTAKRQPMFASAYGELARRRGHHIATVAIARAAAGPVLPHPHPAAGSIDTGAGQYRARSRFRMSLQHGRPA
jgi:transposase